MKKHFLFVHGGPGLNSNADRAFLEDPIKSKGHTIEFWNEPKSFNTDNCYREMLDNLNQNIQQQDKLVNLIGHSFGSKLCLDAISENGDKIESMCFLCPSIDMEKADENIFDISLPLLEESNPEAAQRFKELMPQLTDKVDDNKLEALSLAIQSGYFGKYFVHPENFEDYFQHLQDENAFRLDAYLKIRPTVDNSLKPVSGFKGKSIAFFGKEDQVCTYENESVVVDKVLSDTKKIVMSNVAHYPHVEKRDVFVKELLYFLEE